MKIILAALVIGYAALLRFDAISQTYDPVSTPAWLSRCEHARAGPSLLRPSRLTWSRLPWFPHRDGPPTQYRSDPYTYLQRARAMPSFYAAHLREPLFPFVTRLFLHALDNQDVSVSLASVTFSVLAVVATLALGWTAVSFPVGLFAACLMAIESDVIAASIGGWRDDAFVAAVATFAAILLRYCARPSWPRALLLGVCAALACLVRITALSLVVPVLAWLLVRPKGSWRERCRDAGLVAAVVLLLVGPFLANCWRVYGDPFYSIDAHADVYRATEDAPPQNASAFEYIATHMRARPIATVDTFVLGMTAYPFANKWTGFDAWVPHVGRVLSWASLAGMIVFAASRQGRLLLAVLFVSLLPFAFTWRLISDWRFTEHAYPFLMVAACAALAAGIQALRRPRTAMPSLTPRRVVFSCGSIAVLLAGWFAMTRLVPPLVFRESLQSGDPATILAGDRDAAFFGGEWSVMRAGAITTRVTHATRASILVPLAAGAGYDAIVRLDPSATPVPPGMRPATVGVLLNARLVASCAPGSTPERIGTCPLGLPADAVRNGQNRLTFVSEGTGFRVWYVRVRRQS